MKDFKENMNMGKEIFILLVNDETTFVKASLAALSGLAIGAAFFALTNF